MRVVFFSYGTRGDVQPQVALAAGLQAHGIEARIAAPGNLRTFVERAGIPFAPLFGNSQEILESESGQRWLHSGNVRAFMKEAANIAARIDAEVFRTALDAVGDADAIVGGTLAEDLAFTLAERRGIPFVFAHTMPMESTGDYPSPLVLPRGLPWRFLNRASYALLRSLVWKMHAPALGTFRRQLGLPAASTSVVSRAAALGVPVVQLWSEHLVPHASDAQARSVTTGFQRLPAAVRARLGEHAPSPALLRWLQAGPPPIYIGFGSMPVPALAEFALDLEAIAHSLGQRFALSPGWNDAEPLRHLASQRLHLLGPVDHDWLFAQCRAVVHHGGAGTTAASLTAGVPTVVCSFFADQPYWGARVESLGAGVHLPRRKLDRRTLHAALQRVLGEDVRAAAATLGARLRAEDGNTRATHALLGFLGVEAMRPHAQAAALSAA